jgi:hypothetical protein
MKKTIHRAATTRETMAITRTTGTCARERALVGGSKSRCMEEVKRKMARARAMVKGRRERGAGW